MLKNVLNIEKTIKKANTKTPSWERIQTLEGETQMGMRLTRVESGKYILGYWRREISFDHSYSIRKSRVCTWYLRIMFLFYLINRCICIKRYFYSRIIIDSSIFHLYLHYIGYLCALGVINISWSSLESISERFIPIWYWWILLGFWGKCCFVWIKIWHRDIYSYKYHESKHCLEPLDTIVMVSLVLRMFHIPLQKEQNNYSLYFYKCQCF